MNLSLAFSPCPNDTFISDALVNNKIDTCGINFQVHMHDVEELNKKSLTQTFDITKLSFNAYSSCQEKYIILDSGGALGDKCGPLLIKKPTTILDNNSLIAIPGKLTTANLLFKMAYPEMNNIKEILFSDIEHSVLSNNVQAGLIIHENRFTYHAKGLVKELDLGEFWARQTSLPLPLGGIMASRSLDKSVQEKVNLLINLSIKYAFENPTSSINYTKLHCQEMDDVVIASHINLYVNKYSLSFGEAGKKAIKALLSYSDEQSSNIFL
jgi:1,4-dihydroxy-6-naphthoate synthase